MAVAFLEEEELFEAAVEIGADVVPGIGGIVLVGVRPGVREVDLTGFGTDVGEGVEDMGKAVDRKVLWVMIAAVDGPVDVVDYCFEIDAASHDDGIVWR